MNNNRLKSAFDKIKADDELKEKTCQNVMLARPHRISKKAVLMLSTMSICVLLFIGQFIFKQRTLEIDTIEYSYITIDVNPSIEFILNKDDLILATKAYNAEGETILNEMTFENEDYQTAIANLLKNPLYQSYLNQNLDVQVSIYSADDRKCTEIEESIDILMEEVISSHHYESICVDEMTHQKANHYHVSSGKYVIIQDIITCDDSYDFNALQSKSITELKDIYEDLTNQAYHYDSIHHSEESSEQHQNHHH